MYKIKKITYFKITNIIRKLLKIGCANSIHLIDYFRIFGRGKITNVKTKNIKISKNQKIVNSEIKFSSGDIGIYKCFWNLNAPWAVSILYKDQRYELKPLETLNYYFGNTKKYIRIWKN